MISVIYLVCWAVLDRAALAFESAPEIQVWYPATALNIVLLLVFGLRYGPLLLLNTVVHVLVTGRPLPPVTFLLYAFITTGGYWAACWLLLNVLRINPRLRQLRDVVLLIAIASLAVPLIVAALQVVNFTVSGIIPLADASLLTLQYWAGDATGIAMLAPWLLLVLRRWPAVWAHPEPAILVPALSWPSRRRLAEVAAEASMLGAAVWLAYGAPRGEKLDYTYFVFLPLVWYATRYGLFGAASTVLVINICAALLVHSTVQDEKALTLQFGLMVSSQLGILLGAATAEQRRKEAERRALDHALAAAQRHESIARLARGVAHDFNNMLTTLRGNLELALLDLSPTHEAHSSVVVANSVIDHATDLTRQLLTYAGQAQSELVPVECAKLVRHTEVLLRNSIPGGIALDIRSDPVLPQVMAAPIQLQQVLLNLVVNAAEAIGSTGGTITITTTAEELTAPTPVVVGSTLPGGEYICVSVADTGIGMDEATIQRICEPFFTTKPQGHGIGMSVVLSIVQAYAGGVQIESEPGRGTTVRMLLLALPRTPELPNPGNVLE